MSGVVITVANEGAPPRKAHAQPDKVSPGCVGLRCGGIEASSEAEVGPNEALAERLVVSTEGGEAE